MNATISIVFKSFQIPKLGNYNKIKQNVEKRSGGKLCFIRLPKTSTLFTVLRSPHIDKKSREQFEMKIYKQLIVISSETKYLHTQLQRLTLHDIPGVQLKVILNYKTRLSLSYCS